MPLLNGLEVRQRALELAPPGNEETNTAPGRNAQRHLKWLASASGIPVGTLQNATRAENPQVISDSRVYDLAFVLRRENETVKQTAAAILAPNASDLRVAS